MRLLYGFLVLSFLVGCTKKTPDALPPLRDCTIRVVDGDAPLKGIGVSLQCLEGQGGWSVGGTTDAAGRVVPTTVFGSFAQRGVPEGEYRAILSERIELPPELTLSPDEEMSLAGDEFQRLERRRSDYLEKNRMLPTIVSRPAETPLRVSVAKSGAETTLDVASFR